jgi:hypothetical protein
LSVELETGGHTVAHKCGHQTIQVRVHR